MRRQRPAEVKQRGAGLLILVVAATVAAGVWRGPVAAVAAAQGTGRMRGLAAGKFLVARRDLPDPNFAETVVLLVRYDEKAVMGLVTNRRTKYPLSRLFDDLKEAKGRTDPVYAGGPVAKTGVLALLRSGDKPEGAEHVFADVYMVSTMGLLSKNLAAGTGSHAFRVYLGYAGWAEGQLEREVELGTWYILPGDADMVFDPEPNSVWERVIKRMEMRLALGPMPVRP